MSEKKNWDRIAKIEKAVSEKYGKETIRNPRDEWTDEQEQSHNEQLKKFADKERQWRTKNEKVELEEGVFVSSKLLKKEEDTSRVCPVCETYSFDLKDDLYMTKFDCCWSCYIQHVEGREEQWNNGSKL